MVVGTVAKAKVGELEGYVRYFFNRIMRSYFTGVLGVFAFNKMILVSLKMCSRSNFSQINSRP